MAVIMAPMFRGRRPEGAVVVHTDMEERHPPAPLLARRVHELTRFRRITLVLVAVALAAWSVLKLILYQRYGGFYLGWLEALGATAVILVVGTELWNRLNRRCLRGELVPAQVFLSEGKTALELTLDGGEYRTPNSLAGTAVYTGGISMMRQVVVVYDVEGKSFVRSGPLNAGELPARVDGGFKVICHPRWPKRAVLLTNYDFDPAPGEPD